MGLKFVALPIRIPHAPVVIHRHLAFIRAVAVVAVGARVGFPIDDAAQVADEAA